MGALLPLITSLGYVEDDIVDEAGEVCIRGAVIDIFPADSGEPVRIEVEDGRIVNLHHFDPATQLTCDTIESISIARACEPADEPDANLLDHVTPGRILFLGDADKRRTRFVALAKEASRDGRVDAVEDAAWRAALAKFEQVAWEAESVDAVPRFVEQRRPARALRSFLLECVDAGKPCVIMGSIRDLRFLSIGLNREKGLETRSLGSLADAATLGPGELGLIEGPLDAGAASADIALIAAADIIGSRAELESAGARSSASGGALDFLSVTIGDLVIHEDHGVARLLGLVEDPAVPGGELIALEYARDGRRLVSPADAGRLWRYGSDADAVALDNLNGSSWEKRKVEVMAAVAGTARDLVALAKERAALEAPVIEADPIAYERFVATFPFTETPDQARAIDAVRTDLASGHPMERLVIGDVGYGKTEVALRAAAMAALAGYQVMVAAPTTVLARQHLREFERRFARTGVRVAGVLGTTTAAEKKAIAADLASGIPLVVVGTAAVASKTMRYAKLGLVIIDEEQRFGAADKARLRSHTETHLLVMSATPIPRTLHRSLVGLQAMSVIAKPPARRQPIHTALKTGFDKGVATALKREKGARARASWWSRASRISMQRLRNWRVSPPTRP